MTLPLPVLSGLPLEWLVRVPSREDVPGVVALLRAQRQALGMSGAVDGQAVEAALIGRGSWTRRQLVAFDPQGTLAAWVCVHDRAAGRTNVEFAVHPTAPAPDAIGDSVRDVVASALLRWVDRVAQDVIGERGLTRTRLDATAYALDDRAQLWLTRAGYRLARTWSQMTRPVESTETDAAELALQPGVRVRTVGLHPDGMPVADDLRTVHHLLEESFVDHFNSYRESLAEFLQRQREGPGHTWEHWWLAEVLLDDEWQPGGALIGSVLPEDADGFEGSYVEYLGVDQRARGRGVARALLATIIADAAARGRDRVGLEVDAQSPTRADALYAAMGWRTDYETQSWHRDLELQ
ncbi:GNAT superfamily N-acetyltransferase [Kineosphaera limosa]|uniref:Putative acetyltransferase n=1 Tax=Kineosphaera limosa NBRC 100340 TaxID=1184609 RepID=K6VPS0_9MICO|nr:GNAT family N-acetyltransferase [Kineosphaera limosa]NYE01399.1 GNAT superfamily N-acetyltransferase [Kineosphaera limosa]GAB98208.1 putative acetyltransferase [Kineosphaera limosa NBRC 100340]